MDNCWVPSVCHKWYVGNPSYMLLVTNFHNHTEGYFLDAVVNRTIHSENEFSFLRFILSLGY
jgi:hypothetical protein